MRYKILLERAVIATQRATIEVEAETRALALERAPKIASGCDWQPVSQSIGSPCSVRILHEGDKLV